MLLQAISEQYNECCNHCNPPIELLLRAGEERIAVVCTSQSVACTTSNEVRPQLEIYIIIITLFYKTGASGRAKLSK